MPTRDSRPQLLETLLDRSNQSQPMQLPHIKQRIAALLKLNREIHSLLPIALRRSCRVANYRQGILVLEVASGSQSMRLRYEQANLLSALRARILPSLAAIDITINPDLMLDSTEKGQIKPAPATPLRKITPSVSLPGRSLSLNSAEHLRSVASKSPQKLKEKLERLAALAGESASNARRR